jgi:hypothetical protein
LDVAKVVSAVDSGYSSLASALLLPKETGLASTLTIGQTIKGKVLMQLDRNRYTISFSDKSHTVHSELKLGVNEDIEAKVVAIKDDYVHLKRMDSTSRQTAESPNQTFDKPSDFVSQLAHEYKIPISEGDAKLVQQLARSGNQAHLITTAKILLFLRKIGLTPTREMLEYLLRSFQVKGPIRVDTSGAEIPGIDVAEDHSKGATAADLEKHISALPEELKHFIRDALTPTEEGLVDRGLVSANRKDNRHGKVGLHYTETLGEQERNSDERSDRLPLSTLLNVQNETKLAHKYLALAFLFDNQLIEVDLAIFSARGDGVEKIAERYGYAQKSDSSPDHRGVVSASPRKMNRLSFSLETEALGKIEVQLSTLNRRLNLEFLFSDNTAMTQFVEGSGSLKKLFDAYGWCTDEVKYSVATKDANKLSVAKSAVIEQFILAGSLSRLI